MDIAKVATLQKKYGFKYDKSFNEKKKAYKNIIHDTAVTNDEVKEELRRWQGKGLDSYVSDGSKKAEIARNQMIKIVNNELKSRKI